MNTQLYLWIHIHFCRKTYFTELPASMDSHYASTEEYISAKEPSKEAIWLARLRAYNDFHSKVQSYIMKVKL